ncbi:ATP12 family chaperone protein [Actibacterium sp. 188UL27-1]|uniref:ATP12 family chaperone protein n=1 Tax=Actibacterium sp. 188UL27-1 TaxID=2786961 RepID=UPI0019567876|nr:ATP12 family protein [Actibacterium sp. 188UL27-1]MBM7069969.1 ATPase [Actibacterium sp. 188UL27-1]
MSEWTLKRFWSAASIDATEGGWQILLDSKPVHTPAKSPLIVPSRALAEAIAVEWDAQDEAVDPLSMPLTRSANAAIDKVTPQFDEVIALIAEYGGADQLCYRAEGPDALIQRQAEAWDPLLDWAASGLKAPLAMTTGVMHTPQPANSLQALGARVRALSPFEVTALHDLVGLSGSLIIGLAVLDEVLPAEELWRRSRIDETWQQEQWGIDEEATAAAATKREDFLHAVRFIGLVRRCD